MNTYTNPEETCIACSGARIQIDKNGLRVLCPVCSGRGRYRQFDQPYYKSITVSTNPNPNIKYQMWQ